MVKSFIRTLTFFGKWAAELVRQPALMLSLIAGPFFILLTFGAGMRATPPEPTVIVVADESWRSEDDITEEVREHFNIAAVMRNEIEARLMLHDRQADAVLVLPSEPKRQLDEGEHPKILVITNNIDPAMNAYARTYLINQVNGLNRQTTQLMVVDAQDSIQDTRASIDEAQAYTAQAQALPGSQGSAGLARLEEQLDQTATALDDFNAMEPSLVSSPFEFEIDNIALIEPSYTAFYGPAVLVLLLQHLAMTLGALTMTRIRLLGVMDLLRVSPLKPLEMVLGHYLSYGVLSAIAAAALTVLLVYALGVPLVGSTLLFAAAIGLLIASSLGIGFVIASVSSSEQHSAQVAMLVLLASIFFSGLLFPLEQIAWPARAISYVLPATYAIRSTQDLMLRGDLQLSADFAVLGGAAAALFVLTVLLMRREWRPA